ncbi:MAG: SurA N-terminal domain-containing protein [Bacteroidaceae bacterium]|nr:SurA N-terminal domain-containing protein [Bacteroidaceae bacterium]
MAALQKVRNAGPIVVGALFLGLIGFIATDWTRVVEVFSMSSHNTVGSINGKDIDLQDFNNKVDEYVNVIKANNNLTNLTDEQMQGIRDQVWQDLVQEELITSETNELGLTVTDKELQQILIKGEHPMLSQMPFRNQENKFDYNILKQSIEQCQEILNTPDVSADYVEYASNMLQWWKFMEKNLRSTLLAQKYQSLLAASILSNPVAAQQNFDGRTNEKTLLMAALPYSSIMDSEITVEDKDLKAKYNELKSIFETDEETRNIKYIDIAIKASKEDETELNNQMTEYAQQLAEGAAPAKVIREARSLVPYSTLPISKNTLPNDIASQLDSMSAGQQVGPYYNNMDNTMNIVRLISAQTMPDSVQYRVIGLPAMDMTLAEQSADSIMNAIKAGAPFDTIAKKYNQTGEKVWMASAQYEGMSINETDKKFIEAISTASAGSLTKLVLDNQSVLVINVLETRNPIKKYDVAVVKTSMDFSKQTYDKAFTNFSSFLAGKDAEAIDTLAAKAGYRVLERDNLSSAEHNVGGIGNTRDAMRWIFNEDTKVGDVSPLYECGNNDHLMCIVLTGITTKGYISIDNEDVKRFLTAEVIKDKKAAMLQEKLASAKNISEVAALPGAVTDTLRRVTFAQPVFVSKTGNIEPALSGSASAQAKDTFKNGISGNGAVYAYQVLAADKQETTYDEKAEQGMLRQSALRSINTFQSDLYRKANVEDKRYLFY